MLPAYHMVLQNLVIHAAKKDKSKVINKPRKIKANALKVIQIEVNI